MGGIGKWLAGVMGVWASGSLVAAVLTLPITREASSSRRVLRVWLSVRDGDNVGRYVGRHIALRQAEGMVDVLVGLES